jgi:pSer/pThr/pTyr-binding forkhead associated (FHA) protein
VAVHCPECGFLNGEGAKFCQNCGSNLGAQTQVQQPESTTATYRVGETGELIPVDVEEITTHGHAALVIRSGGNRVGESFPLEGDRMTVGRRPDSDVFLDDVTVSRDHALVVKRGGDFYLDDLGSLNGTYVNRRRIESHKLADGDELQIGKYKLTFLQR